MFARVVEFSPTSDAAAQFVQVIEETALRIVEAKAGCIAAFVELPENSEHVVLGISVWQSKSNAEWSGREYYPDVENMLRPFLKCSPELHTFEVREITDINVRARPMYRKQEG